MPPFRSVLDPECLFLSRTHQEGLAALYYAAAHRCPLALLSGAPGIGKSTLAAAAALRLDAVRAKARVLVLSDPRITGAELLETLVSRLSPIKVSESRPARLGRLRDLLMDALVRARLVLLVLDDAHRLGDDALEEVRLLTELTERGNPLLPVVLSGSGRLDERLGQPEYASLAQRVEIRCQIQPLPASEVEAYIRFRWSRAAGGAPPFDHPALQAIAELSQGVPRAVNWICRQALQRARAARISTVGPDLIYDPPLAVAQMARTRRRGSGADAVRLAVAATEARGAACV